MEALQEVKRGVRKDSEETLTPRERADKIAKVRDEVQEQESIQRSVMRRLNNNPKDTEARKIYDDAGKKADELRKEWKRIMSLPVVRKDDILGPDIATPANSLFHAMLAFRSFADKLGSFGSGKFEGATANEDLKEAGLVKGDAKGDAEEYWWSVLRNGKEMHRTRAETSDEAIKATRERYKGSISGTDKLTATKKGAT